ncbi:MAG: dTDP-4-dehydrorhamnose reductase [Bacteroidota bacterium]
MKLLITGSNGLLGQKLTKLCMDQRVDFLATSRKPNVLTECPSSRFQIMDVTDKPQVKDRIASFQPDVIVNTAAMTAVDKCEDEKEKCLNINVEGVRNIAEAINLCSTHTHLVQLSTDFIFDGNQRMYSEEDEAGPLSVYGDSKWRAERLIQELLSSFTIVRTSLVYGEGESLSKGNIFSWSIEKLKNDEELTIVDDQFRSPTFADDLATGCLDLAHRRYNGIVNIAGPKVQSMYAYIQEIAIWLGKSPDLVQPISSEKLAQKARRPAASGLQIKKARELINYKPHPFIESIAVMNPKK